MIKKFNNFLFEMDDPYMDYDPYFKYPSPKGEKYPKQFVIDNYVQLIDNHNLTEEEILFFKEKKCHKVIDQKIGNKGGVKIKVEGKNKFYMSNRFVICKEIKDDDSQFEDGFEENENDINNKIQYEDNDDADYDENRQFRPNELIFCIIDDPDGGIVLGQDTRVRYRAFICPRRFFERNHYMHDDIGGHNVGAAIRQIRRDRNFRVWDVELMEGIFEVQTYLTKPQVIQEFLNAGFQQNQEFCDFIDNHH